MNKKVGDVFRILLGCYLIFLGVCLWIRVSEARPTDERTMTLFAVILIAVGSVSFLVSALALASCLKGKGHFRKRKKKTASDDTVEIRLDEQWKQPAPGKTTERPAEEARRTEKRAGTDEIDRAEKGAAAEELKEIKDMDKTEEMPKIEELEKIEEIESDYEEK